MAKHLFSIAGLCLAALTACALRAPLAERLVGGRVTGDEVAAALASQDPDLRARAAGHCARTDAGACGGLPSLAIRDPDRGVRLAALNALSRRCTGPDRTVLRRVCGHADVPVIDLVEAVRACPSGDAGLAVTERAERPSQLAALGALGVRMTRPWSGLDLRERLAVAETLLRLGSPDRRLTSVHQVLQERAARQEGLAAVRARVDSALESGALADAQAEVERARAAGHDVTHEAARVEAAVEAERERFGADLAQGRFEQARQRLEILAAVSPQAREALEARWRDAFADRRLAEARAALDDAEFTEASRLLDEVQGAAPERSAALKATRLELEQRRRAHVEARWSEAKQAGTLEAVRAFVDGTPPGFMPEGALPLLARLEAEAERARWLAEPTEADPRWLAQILGRDLLGFYEVAHVYDTPLKRKRYAATAEYRDRAKELAALRRGSLRKDWYLVLAAGDDVDGYDCGDERPNLSAYNLQAGGFWVCLSEAAPAYLSAFRLRNVRRRGRRVFVPAPEAAGARIERSRDALRIVLRLRVERLGRSTWLDLDEEVRRPVIVGRALAVEVRSEDDGSTLHVHRF